MATSSDSVRVHVVRVFCDAEGGHGNPLGVVVDGASVPDAAERQELAFELGFSETVFVDDAAAGRLRIFTPVTEFPLAGHPLVGTAWLLGQLGDPVSVLRPPAGEVPTGLDGAAGAWIEADPSWGPPWRLRELASPEEVDGADASELGPDAEDYLWAWVDEPAGVVRARAFATLHGVVEDEATGSAALRLAGELGRAVEIRQGRGSVIGAEPVDGGRVRVGGRVVLDDDDLRVGRRR